MGIDQAHHHGCRWRHRGWKHGHLKYAFRQPDRQHFVWRHRLHRGDGVHHFFRFVVDVDQGQRGHEAKRDQDPYVQQRSINHVQMDRQKIDARIVAGA